MLNENKSWLSKYRIFKDSGSFPRQRPMKTYSKLIRTDLKERKVSKDLAQDRNAWKAFIGHHQIHTSIC